MMRPAELPRSGSSAAGAEHPGAGALLARLHLVLLPPTETISSGGGAVAFGHLVGAVSALSLARQSLAPSLRNSKLLLLLRDVLRPAVEPAPAVGKGARGPALAKPPPPPPPPPLVVVVASVSQDAEHAAHALTTLKLASRLAGTSGRSLAGEPMPPATDASAPLQPPLPASATRAVRLTSTCRNIKFSLMRRGM
jgi:hypothetical protein